MAERFTDTLKNDNRATWDAAVEHRFVRELGEGTIANDVMAGYLVQDFRFLDGFLALLGAAIATADTLDARLRFARFAGDVSDDENTYFLRSFDALGVDAEAREQVPDTAATRGFRDIFREAAETRRYASILAVLVVSEWLYLEWAKPLSDHLPSNFVHAEWITLHDNPDFRDLVEFLRSELDRVGPSDADAAADFFGRTTRLEQRFFDDSYEHPLHV